MKVNLKRDLKKISASLVDFQLKIEALPPLSGLQKAKFDQDFAIDQLYYSSKMEGTILTNENINTAIHGKKDKIQTA